MKTLWREGQPVMARLCYKVDLYVSLVDELPDGRWRVATPEGYEYVIERDRLELL